jgi:Tol biopolymer transport system component
MPILHKKGKQSMYLRSILFFVMVGFGMTDAYALKAPCPPMTTHGSLSEEQTQNIKNQESDKSAIQRPVVVKMLTGRPITGKEDFLAAKWSPDGRFMLLTKGKYRGLYILSLEDQSVRTLTDAHGVGYDAKWSQDGRFIVIREHERLKVIDMKGNPVTSEHASPEEASSVVYTRDDVVYFRSSQARPETKVSSGEDKFFMPLLSPDRKKVAYIGLSSGIHIKNLENGGIVSIGGGTDIAWTPDAKGIIYTRTVDDGHRIVSSDLYFADARGGEVINLTMTPDRRESHAAISPAGSGLAYIVDGQVFFSELSYERPRHQHGD